MLLSLIMAAPEGASGGFTVLMFQIGLIGLVFYFLIIRPQGQARKKHAEILGALKKGDEITTAGGIIGRVKEIKEERVTIETGTSTIVVERGRIIRVGDHVSPAAAQR
ncbi:MAG TPA: preprotein translocase subunit YajC [Gemmatimonadales bacterium]|nr:preprotein translocase subunit YajC [Gemmatimonadales bacterium]